MPFFRVTKNSNWTFEKQISCYVSWQLYMPRILCPERCSGSRSTENEGYHYPAADFHNDPGVKRLLQPVELPLEDWQKLHRRVAAALPTEVPVRPGTTFGMNTAEVSGSPADCYPGHHFILSAEALERLESLGIKGLFPAPLRVKTRRKLPSQLLELQIEHTASLAGQLDLSERMARLRRSGIQVAEKNFRCPVCGRSEGDLPRSVVLKGYTIPEGVHLFRLRERPIHVFCSEPFAEAVRKLKLTNILFEPVKTDGSEKRAGFAKVIASQPQAWAGHKSPEPRAQATGKAREAAPPRSPRPQAALAEVLSRAGLGESVAGLALPTVRFTLNPAEKLPQGQSRTGGLPELPKGVRWPGTKRAPLDFLLQLNLADLPRLSPESSLPERGFLWFFFDTDTSPWGTDPKDKRGWKVIYRDCAASDLRTAVLPGWSSPDAILPQCSMTFAPGISLPAPNSAQIKELNLTADQQRRYAKASRLLAQPGGEEDPVYKLLGQADAIQQEMTIGCAMAANGYSAHFKPDLQDPKQRAAVAQAKDWRLLLQLDSDSNGGMEWGDGGRLYFWIREQDLAKRRFDRCWCMLQTF